MGEPMTGPNRSSQCYGRTDGRTKRPITHVDPLTAVDTGARIEDAATIGEILASGPLWMTGERHEVIRRGERTEIPAHVRAAVWFRDRGKCELCGTTPPEGQPWHLDHITPWSAGGADDTTNLRVLCERHNLERGNRIDPTERPRRAATWWCVNCYDDAGLWLYVNGVPACTRHNASIDTPSPRCRVVRAYRSAWERTGEWPTWHLRATVEGAEVVAYCAHCDAPGMTDVTL